MNIVITEKLLRASGVLNQKKHFQKFNQPFRERRVFLIMRDIGNQKIKLYILLLFYVF